MKRHLSRAATWIQDHIDMADVLGLVGLALAYDGARAVFGSGWARLGLGCALLTLYILIEARKLPRAQKGGSR